MDEGLKQTYQKKELQGPRPTPLKVRKNSHKIKKPPLLPQNDQQLRQPVIIYTVSPKVIHTDPTEFMSLVQRLTGTTSAAPPPLPDNWHGGGGGGGVSPAARLAATERTRAAEVEKGSSNYEGILSPCPEMLPQVAAGFFTTEMENSNNNNNNTVGFFSSPNFLGYQMMMNTSPTVCSDLFGFYFDQ